MDDDTAARGLTCQVQVLQGSLGSQHGAELRVESAFSVIRTVDFTFGCSDVVCVCDGRAGVDVLDLRLERHRD